MLADVLNSLLFLVAGQSGLPAGQSPPPQAPDARVSETRLVEAVRTLVQFDRTFEPDAARRGYYDGKFGKYFELYRALQPFNAGYP